MWEKYYTPASLEEALELLAEYGEQARIMAGGTDIIIELERGIRPGVKALIDITRIAGLSQISLGGDELIHLGPLVTHNHVVNDGLVVTKGLPLAQACWEVGSPQIRNRGTIAGNLITASPANDTITPLLAMDGQITLHSLDASREVPLSEFYTGVRQTVMQPDELLTDVAFKPLEADQRGVFLKLGLRKAQAISVVDIAVILRFDDEKITQARITLGSVAPTIISAPRAETYLVGRVLTNNTINEAAKLAGQSATPIDDVRGSAAYRVEMVRTLMRQALRMLRDHTERESYPDNPVMLWGNSKGMITERLTESFAHDRNDVIETTINGQTMTIEGAASKTLLRMLREDAHLTGTKEGCAEGECGACTVFLDGMAVMACMVAAPRAHHAQIVTVEGLADGEQLHPIQQGFVEEGAVQCGYCTPGFLMAGAKLLEERPRPTIDEMQQSVTGNLCRCTGYYKILSAFERAADLNADRQ